LHIQRKAPPRPQQPGGSLSWKGKTLVEAINPIKMIRAAGETPQPLNFKRAVKPSQPFLFEKGFFQK
jgi:hypothetical protein